MTWIQSDLNWRIDSISAPVSELGQDSIKYSQGKTSLCSRTEVKQKSLSWSPIVDLGGVK